MNLMNQVPETKRSHIRLTSHPGSRGAARFPLVWGAGTARERGPVIATVNSRGDRNAIGAHGGSYSVYRALAISAGAMDPQARPDLHDTSPVCEIGPHPQWGEPGRIVSLDPWGHRVAHDFADLIADGLDVRPTIAITKARLTLHEIREAIADWISGRVSRALVIAIDGRMSIPSLIRSPKSWATRWPQGSSETILLASPHWGCGPI